MACSKSLTSVIAAAATVWLLDLTGTADACRCDQASVCERFHGADVVVRGGSVHSSTSGGINGEVSYNFGATNIYKEGNLDSNLLYFSTPASGAACGISLEFQVEYVIGLYHGEREGLFTANLCGLHQEWDSLSGEEQAAVEAGCPDVLCEPVCGQFQECLLHSDYNGNQHYCADVCVPSSCEAGEMCCLEQLVDCFVLPCPPSAVCKLGIC